MKTINAISILLIFLFASAIVYPQGVQTYKNLKYNYKITIPDKWQIEEKPSSRNPENVTFTDLDGYKMTISSKVDKSYANKTANDIDVGTMFSLFQKIYKSANFVESDYAAIDNNTALYCKYSYADDGKEYIFVHYYVIKSNVIYTIQIFAKSENFEYFETLSRGYIYSFTIANVTAPNAYKNEKLGFRIIFPDNWKMKTEASRFGAESSDGANIYIEVNDGEDFTGYSANDLRADDMVEILRTKYSDANVYEKFYSFIDNIPALFVRYKCTATISGKTDNFTLVHYYLIRRRTFYILQGMAPTSVYESNRETIMRSIESFQFLEENNY